MTTHKNEDNDFFIPEIQSWLEHQSEKRKMGFEYSILVNGKIRLVSMMEWFNWFANIKNRRIDYTDISNCKNYPNGEFVSTIFLGCDFKFKDADEFIENKPMLFETMVFGGKYNQRGWQYSTFGEAKRGHYTIVKCIENNEKPYVNYGERPFMELFLEMFDESE